MARISGVDIPREKRLVVSLTYIYGIGLSTAEDVCAAVGIDQSTRVRDLTDDLLDAGDGRDVLFGNGGDDTFVGEGDYSVIGFRAGAGSEDRINLRGVEGLDDFGDVLASARHTRIGVVLDFGDDEITLLGVNASQLHADDFLI